MRCFIKIQDRGPQINFLHVFHFFLVPGLENEIQDLAQVFNSVFKTGKLFFNPISHENNQLPVHESIYCNLGLTEKNQNHLKTIGNGCGRSVNENNYAKFCQS